MRDPMNGKDTELVEWIELDWWFEVETWKIERAEFQAYILVWEKTGEGTGWTYDNKFKEPAEPSQ